MFAPYAPKLFPHVTGYRPSAPVATGDKSSFRLASLLREVGSRWLSRIGWWRYVERRVLQLKGRTEVHRRILRRLHREAPFAARRIDNGPDIPLSIHVYLHSAPGTQGLV